MFCRSLLCYALHPHWENSSFPFACYTKIICFWSFSQSLHLPLYGGCALIAIRAQRLVVSRQTSMVRRRRLHGKRRNQKSALCHSFTKKRFLCLLYFKLWYASYLAFQFTRFQRLCQSGTALFLIDRVVSRSTRTKLFKYKSARRSLHEKGFRTHHFCVFHVACRVVVVQVSILVVMGQNSLEFPGLAMLYDGCIKNIKVEFE